MNSGDSKVVDVFTPVTAGNCMGFPAAICSALTQSYSEIRLVIFLDHIHPTLEAMLDDWVYTAEDEPRKNTKETFYADLLKPITIEYCSRGVIVRNHNGPMGSAAVARQWYFEWEDKADYLRPLDSDDIILPECVATMISYITPECDGVMSPIIFVSACRYGHIKSGKLETGHFSSGSVLLKRETIERMGREGFVWPRIHSHDEELVRFLIANKYKFNLTEEDFLYLYLKA